MSAIYYRVPDTTLFWAGHYGQTHVLVPASAATAMLMQSETTLGFEVYFTHAIERKEIQKVRTLSQVIGWRFSPDAHGRMPCSCDYCTFGEPGGRRLREREKAEAAKRVASLGDG
jgi:hypothetical protein